MPFEDALRLVQSLPTHDWSNEMLSELLAKSFELKQRYHWNSHLEVSKKSNYAKQGLDEKDY